MARLERVWRAFHAFWWCRVDMHRPRCDGLSLIVERKFKRGRAFTLKRYDRNLFLHTALLMILRLDDVQRKGETRCGCATRSSSKVTVCSARHHAFGTDLGNSSLSLSTSSLRLMRPRWVQPVLTFAAMALPTKGRVIIETTVGEIDIELWSKVLAS